MRLILAAVILDSGASKSAKLTLHYAVGKVEAPRYQGCYANEGGDRLDGHMVNKSFHWCATAARIDALTFFGMEWPEGFEVDGNAECLPLSGHLSLARAPDSECESKVFQDIRLGGPNRLAVYALPSTEVAASEPEDEHTFADERDSCCSAFAACTAFNGTCCPDAYGMTLSCCAGESWKYDGVYSSKWDPGNEVFVIHGHTINWNSNYQTAITPDNKDKDAFMTQFPGEEQPRKARYADGLIIWEESVFKDVWFKWQPPPVDPGSSASPVCGTAHISNAVLQDVGAEADAGSLRGGNRDSAPTTTASSSAAEVSGDRTPKATSFSRSHPAHSSGRDRTIVLDDSGSDAPATTNNSASAPAKDTVGRTKATNSTSVLANKTNHYPSKSANASEGSHGTVNMPNGSRPNSKRAAFGDARNRGGQSPADPADDAASECGAQLQEGAAFEPLGMAEGPGPLEAASAAECRELCQKERLCERFTFQRTNKSHSSGRCHFQDAFATRRTGKAGFVAGPRKSWCQLPPKARNHWVRAAGAASSRGGVVSYTPPDYRCMTIGGLYTPRLESRVVVSAGRADPAGILACQRWCNSSPGCRTFSIELASRTCSLHRSDAKLLFPSAGYVGGPASCDGTPVLRPNCSCPPQAEPTSLSDATVWEVAVSLAVGSGSSGGRSSSWMAPAWLLAAVLPCAVTGWMRSGLPAWRVLSAARWEPALLRVADERRWATDTDDEEFDPLL